MNKEILGFGRAATMALALTAACGHEASVPVSPNQGHSSAALVGENGIELNGIELNGIELNGIELNGIELNGIELNGIELNGSEFGGEVNGSRLHGMDFVGARLSGRTSDGERLRLRIDAITVQEDVWLYQVSFRAEDGWSPLCGAYDDGNAVMATALSGTWDYSRGTPTGGSHINNPSMFTFACMHTALGKCVTFGYAPWRSVVLADAHEACTRMVRADYCGNGNSYTTNGTPIDVIDSLGIQVDDPAAANWDREAEWNVDGAGCINRPRHPDQVASCDNQLHDSDCATASHFQASNALLMTKVQPIE